MAFLWNPDVRGAVLDYNQTEGAARSLGLQLQSVEAPRAEDLDSALSAITEQHAQALIVPFAEPGDVREPGEDRELRAKEPVAVRVRR